MTESHDAPGSPWGRPAADTTDAPPELSRWEVLGAWLHVWTPPRGAHVPAIPWRTIGIRTGIAVVVLGIAAAIAIPLIDQGKREGAAREAVASQRLKASERAAIERSQTPHRASATKPAGAVTVAQRVALFETAKDAVLSDAKGRVEAGTLKSPVSAVTCVRAPQGTSLPANPERDLSLATAAYDCTAITGRIKATKHNVAGALGYPFRLKVDFTRFSYLWCKQTPLPGEQVVPNPKDVVPLPKVCRV
jgi:hypothetical protein